VRGHRVIRASHPPHELTVERLGIGQDRLYATVFGGDEQVGPDTESLRTWGELDYAEIAAIESVPIGTIRSRLAPAANPNRSWLRPFPGAACARDDVARGAERRSRVPSAR